MKKIKLSWINPKLKVGLSKKGGKGSFSQKNIDKGELIAIFGGHILTKKQFYQLPEEIQEFPYQVDDNFLLGPIDKIHMSSGEFFNHSCNPNAGFKDNLRLVAMKDIKKGDETTFDYAMCMTSDILNMKCLCGEKNCRGIVKGSDWKNPKLQKKYRGFFQPYIKEKISKIKIKN